MASRPTSRLTREHIITRQGGPSPALGLRWQDAACGRYGYSLIAARPGSVPEYLCRTCRRVLARSLDAAWPGGAQ